MKKDIDFEPVKDVTVTVVKRNEDDWQVYLINRSTHKLDTILVTSKGYGSQNGESQKTSLLRHSIPFLDPGMHALIEPIQKTVFHLTNEYWVSYYIGNKIFDKKFIFVPDTIIEKNLTFIPELDAQGVLHD
jgi:hypothetical protein